MDSRLRWTSDENFTLDDVAYASLARNSEPGRLTIYKPRHAIEQYEALVEAARPRRILEMGIFGVSPFETIDKDGVGALVAAAAKAGRETRPDIKLGVCGEHGGDPESVHFFHEVGLDYVSCSPFRIPVARLEAGRAASS